MSATGLASFRQVFRPLRKKPTRRTYVDFVFGLDYLSVNSHLLRVMHRALSTYGLSCLLVNQSSVERTIESVRKGRLRPLVYLDLCSRPGDRFHTLLQTMSAVG